MLEKYMVTEKEFRNVVENHTTTGFQVKVRVPYYRGIFLSMIEDYRVTVDGEFFGPDKIRFALNDRKYAFNELKNVLDVHWDFGQWATLMVGKPGGLAPGMHTVEVGVLVRTSYVLPKELDPEGLFRQGGPGSPEPPSSPEERYRFTTPSPGAGRAVRKMTIVE